MVNLKNVQMEIGRMSNHLSARGKQLCQFMSAFLNSSSCQQSHTFSPENAPSS